MATAGAGAGLAASRVRPTRPPALQCCHFAASTGVVALTQGMQHQSLPAGGRAAQRGTINLLDRQRGRGPLGYSARFMVILACGLYLLVRSRCRTPVLIPFMIAVIGIPWLFPHLDGLCLPSSWPWEFIRQHLYFEKYTLLSGTALFGAFFPDL